MENKTYKKSNFGAAFLFLPKEKRNALSVLYSFCRLADDIVDEHFDNASQMLQDLRNEVERVFSGEPQTALGCDLQLILKNYKIPKTYFLDLLDGVSLDLNKEVRFKTFGDLNWYIYRVACVVGLMCIEIFGYKNDKTKEYAVLLGQAVQMTNILRDIAEDVSLNRIYLPKEDLEMFGVKEEEILSLQHSQKIKALLFFEMQRAQNFYIEARNILPKEDFSSMLTARAMGAIYEDILNKLISGTRQIDIKKLKLSKFRKIAILYKSWRQTK